MQLPEVLCYFMLMITVAASYVDAEDTQTYELTHSEPERRIAKREAFIVNKYLERLYPKPIYRRIQQAPRQTPKSNTFRPPRPHRRHPNRKPSKKYKSYHNAMPPKHKLSTPKQKRNSKNRYRSKLKLPSYAPTIPKVASFGEPPIDFPNEFPKQSYGEPPIDSYGAPLNPKVDEYDYNKQTYPVWVHDEEANFGFSNKPPIAKTEVDDTFVKRIPQDFTDNVYRNRPKGKNSYKKKKTHYFNKMYDQNKQKKIHESSQDDEILVGGQYAEPPPRYVPKYRDKPSAAVIDTDDEFSPLYGFVGPKVASPYINYKNSNMAFSPQNLNDAFSLVDV